MTIKVTPTAPLPALPISRPDATAPGLSATASPKGQPRLDPDWANVTADHGSVADVELSALSLPEMAPAAPALPVLAEEGGPSRTSGGAGGRRA